MKIIDEIETQRSNSNKNKDRKEGGTKAIVNGWELNDFVMHLT